MAVAIDTTEVETAGDSVSSGAPGADADLVAAAVRGERLAFTRLYERYGPVVHGALVSRVPAQDAVDLVQDVFAIALARLDGLRQPDSIGGWLLAIARARAADYWREAMPRGELQEEASPEAADASHMADATRVLEALRTLPDAYREVLAMRLVEGLKGPEIAARTGLRPGSVRVNLHRGMALLREKLGWKDSP